MTPKARLPERIPPHTPTSIAIPSPEHPDDAFAAVVALRRLAATLERETVDRALADGWTWSEIGQALGMSAQAAHKRLAPSRRTTP